MPALTQAQANLFFDATKDYAANITQIIEDLYEDRGGPLPKQVSDLLVSSSLQLLELAFTIQTYVGVNPTDYEENSSY